MHNIEVASAESISMVPSHNPVMPLDNDGDHLVQLLPGEELRTIRPIPLLKPTHKLSALLVMRKLTNAGMNDKIGENGPSLASVSLDSADEDLKLYEAIFGRDSLFTASVLLEWHPELARTTLFKLAETQGINFDSNSEEEPGRIAHEIRDPATDPIAQKLTEERGWGWPYYGSVDATPDFIRLLVAYSQTEHCAKVDGGAESFLNSSFIAKDGNVNTMAGALEGALGWLQHRMKINPEGLVEFWLERQGGTENQVWRDSWDAFSHANGKLVDTESSIAALDVQRVAYDALLDLADLYAHFPSKQLQAVELYKQANALGAQIVKYLWTEEDGGYFMLGLERTKNGELLPLKIKTSDMGHMLASRLLVGEDAQTRKMREATIRQLHSPEMLASAGVRTLASDEVRFREGAYHNGTVWPRENFLIAHGLRQHKEDSKAASLEDKILEAVNTTGLHPEHVRGGNASGTELNTRVVEVWDKTHQRYNTVEQPPMPHQAWTAAVALAIKYRRGDDFKAQWDAEYKPASF